jgi:4-amino-4-deoxy-L-arabinose transferase-like glycosyltransferase
MSARVWQAAALLVVAAGLGLYLLWLGDMALTDRDEGEYAAAVAAMERNHDYVVPTLNGKLYLEKPILIFWAVAAGQTITGQGELGARLPSAVSAVLLMLFAGWLVWRMAGSLAPGVLAAALCGFTPLMALVGRACLTDTLLTLFTTLSLGLFFVATEKEAPRDRRWYLAAWAALGLAFLIKGPVGPAVVLPTALIYTLWQRNFLQVLRRAQIHWGLLIFLAINLPWYGLAFHRLGETFWNAFFVSQNLRRFSEVLLGHGGGYFYYLPVLLVGGFPLAAAALPELGRALAANRKEVRASDPMARLRLFAAIASVVVFIVFTLAATKQINYILPALPFLAVLGGYFLWRRAAGEPMGRLAGTVFWITLWLTGGIWVLALAAVPLGVGVAWPDILGSIRPDSSEYALPAKAPLMVLWPLVGALLGAAALAGAWILHRRGQGKWLGLSLSAGGAFLAAVLVLGLFPQAAQVIQQPAKDMALAVKAKAGKGAEVVSFGLWKPSLFYYLDRDIPRIRSTESKVLAEALARPEPVMVLTRTGLPALKQVAEAREIKQYEGYLLAGNQAAKDLWSGGAPKETTSAPALQQKGEMDMPSVNNQAADSAPAGAKEKRE